MSTIFSSSASTVYQLPKGASFQCYKTDSASLMSIPPAASRPLIGQPASCSITSIRHINLNYHLAKCAPITHRPFAIYITAHRQQMHPSKDILVDLCTARKSYLALLYSYFYS